MSSIRLQIKDNIMHYLCDDWNNHKRGKAHKENIGLYDREDSKPIWCNIDLEMIMEKVVKGIYATDFDAYEKQIRADVLKPIAQMIDNYACGRELHVINAINNYIYEKTKEQTE